MAKRLLISVFLFLITPFHALAHEAYVLSPTEFRMKLQGSQFNVFEILGNPEHLRYIILAGAFGTLLFLGVLLFFRSAKGKALEGSLESLESFGALFLRLGTGGALLFGAFAGHVFGPEISLGIFPETTLRTLAGLVGGAIILGIHTRIASGIGLLLYFSLFIPNGAYLFAYFGYVGAFGVLLISGGGRWSFDKRRGASATPLPSGATLVRVTYGLMLLYAALAIKFLAPTLTLAVVENFNLARGIFPGTPELVVLSAALTEATLALLIIFGFGLRFALFIDLIFTTAALIYLPEPAWPHLIMYAAMFYLFVTPQAFSVDTWIAKRFTR